VKPLVLILALAAIPSWAQMGSAAKAAPATLPLAEQPLVPRLAISNLEKDFDARISTAGGIDPMKLMGNTRGLYLKGYGVVFTAEVDLIMTSGITPFHTQITKAEVDATYQRKLNHLPILKQAMADMVKASASSLDSVPDNEKIVVAVRLWYHSSWENTAGLPVQILLQATRKAALAGDIKEEIQ
jgi:hypothetical protein